MDDGLCSGAKLRIVQYSCQWRVVGYTLTKEGAVGYTRVDSSHSEGEDCDTSCVTALTRDQSQSDERSSSSCPLSL